MSKNTKTLGLIPDGYGITLNYGHKKIFFTPSRVAEGIAILLPKKYLKDEWNNYYPDSPFSELENAVMKKKGSKNLIMREGVIERSQGGTVAYGIVKGRGHSGRGDRNGNRTVAYTTMIKGVPMPDGEISKTFDVSCGCDDYIYNRGSDEFNNPRMACAHISATLMSYVLGEKVPYLEDIVNECKPMLKGEPLIPYNLHERMDLVMETLHDRYMDNKKLYDIDVKLMNEDIVSPAFKKGVKEGILTYNCSKNCENYTDSLSKKMGYIRKWLIEAGLERTGIAREFDGKCYWNFKIDDDRDLRPIPNIPKNTIELLDVRYIDNLDYNEVRKRYSNGDYGLDPMRKRMRVGITHKLGNYIRKEDVLEVVQN